MMEEQHCSTSSTDGVTKMINPIGYTELGELRFLEFFEPNDIYSRDETGGSECAIGHACVDGYAFTYFASPARVGGATSEIALDFDNDCPEREGHVLLENLGLPLRRGMSFERVCDILGPPLDPTPTWPRFVVGDQEQYYVSCHIREESGLCSLIIARKDLVDKHHD